MAATVIAAVIHDSLGRLWKAWCYRDGDLILAALRPRPARQQQLGFFLAPNEGSQTAWMSASKRLSTVLACSATQARTGSAMPLRSLAQRSLSSKGLPRNLRVASATRAPCATPFSP